jgi:predicted permease
MLLQDLRYAARTLRGNPGFTAVAAATLALGIGANSAIFSVVEAVLLRPLPYKDPGRLILLADPTTYTDFQAWKSQAGSFEDMAVYYRNIGRARVTLTGSGEPEAVQGGFVSANFFPLMGVSPLIGRWLTSDEETRHERVVILSHGLWSRRFGASPAAIGEFLQIEGANWRVIGVMPSTFQFPASNVQFWAPVTANRSWGEVIPFDPNYSRYAYARWDIVARLKPGVSLDQAQVEMSSINTRLEQSSPQWYRARKINLVPLRINLSGNTRLAFYVLFGAVSFVLLIACTNVANLVLARGAAREREVAIRTALGANRGRLIRQLFTESVVLAVLSGCLGLVLAVFGIRALVSFGPPDIPRLDQAGLDVGVLSFALAVSLCAAILFGLAPAFRISRSNPSESLKSGATRTRNLLVVAEFALSVILLTGAGLLVRSFLAVERVDPGFRPEHVLTMRITMPAGASPARSMALDELTLERIRAIPGVQASGAISGLLVRNPGSFGLRSVEGKTPESQAQWTPLDWTTIRSDYVQAMGSQLLRGRFFTEQDGKGTPLVAIVDETMARRYWPGEDPIGKRFKGFDARGRNDEWLSVIGVVRDMRRHGREHEPAAHIYQWYKQSDQTTPDLVVRTTGDPKALAATLRQVVRGLDGTAILSPVTTLEQQLAEQLSPRRFQTGLLGLFSLIALVLASVGIYGVMHYSVTQRTHEIGIRMALGARPGDVLRMVIRQGLTLALAGLAVGLAGAWWLTRVLASLLYGVTPADPPTFLAVSFLLTIVAALATSIPAWRAANVDPLLSLRHD